MNVLLSIKPKYVEEIKKGNKKYEFRKKGFSKKSINEAYIYSTSPIKKIIGSFKIKSIIKDHPKNLWATYKDFSGISEDEFFKYFGNREIGFAIEINRFKMFQNPIDPERMIPNFVAPQSFRYIDIKELDSTEYLTLDQYKSK